ncbi:MAG: NFACT family protein [Candidatus Lokiarchaeota archaeon]|nr:NFACT family protein [Candidatus Lokiarchaeota archaeon]
MPKTQNSKKNVSNIDVYVIAKELNTILGDGFIENVYEISDNLLKIRCRTKMGKKDLILDASKRMNITSYAYPVPSMPSQYCSALRKHLKGRRITRVYQYELDRVLIIELASNTGEPWKFIVEMFLGGNFLLIDGENRIFMAKHYKIYKDRRILAKADYIPPIQNPIHFMNMTKDDLTYILKNSQLDLVRTISKNISLVGYIAEEMCKRARLDKNKNANFLTEEEVSSLFQEIQGLIVTLNQDKFSGIIYSDENDDYVFFEPFDLLIHSDLKNKAVFPSFNEAIDEFFAKKDAKSLLSSDSEKVDKVVRKYERIHESQKEQIANSKENREEHLFMGDLIYSNLIPIDNLLSNIKDARKRGFDWKTILERLKKGKELKIEEALIFHRAYPKEAKIAVKLDDKIIRLDFRKNATENATHYYKLAKRDKRRIEGAKSALKQTKTILDEKQIEKELTDQQQISLIKQPKKQWYEKFRWFKSSDGFLVIGGKDASSNEVIVKKYMEKNDLYLHTEIRGAPSTVIKNPDDKTIPELTIKEASSFAASYSNAWREGWGSTKIYYVHPDQVTKSPNPGEYLSKGSFFIQGEKTYLPPPFLELSIGLVLEVVGQLDEGIAGDKNIYFPRIIAGPQSAIKSQTKHLVRIKPQGNGLSGGKLAEKIKAYFVSGSTEDVKKWVNLIDINHIIHFLPPGNSYITKK